ncbi:uncharacterized protein Dlip3 [Eurosta solidaginis]|uniref:uncharacterized protein Dlip3 n=1 Tax=Eurosta solidaginis TaxID=178769 RepID=UPI00353126F1
MRESFGPDFDDKLIRLVRDNPAIYDVNHEHYRRYQIRVAIWERIAAELRVSSKFLQTKWKNIRYNYLQEVKSLETGIPNAHIRKRRCTEDLSFLLNTAQSYSKIMQMNTSYNSADNDSNSYLYGDTQNPNAYEIVEIDNSDNDATPLDYGVEDYNVAMDTPQMQENTSFPLETNSECYDDNQLQTEFVVPKNKTVKTEEPKTNVKMEQKHNLTTNKKRRTTPDNGIAQIHSAMGPPSPVPSNASSNSSPFITPPIVVMGNDDEFVPNGEVTMKPTSKQSALSSKEIISNATKRKSMPAPFPVLTPINDPIEMYCLSLVDSFRNMPRSERERVKFEFAKILKDAKYKDQS